MIKCLVKYSKKIRRWEEGPDPMDSPPRYDLGYVYNKFQLIQMENIIIIKNRIVIKGRLSYHFYKL